MHSSCGSFSANLLAHGHRRVVAVSLAILFIIFASRTWIRPTTTYHMQPPWRLCREPNPGTHTIYRLWLDAPEDYHSHAWQDQDSPNLKDTHAMKARASKSLYFFFCKKISFQFRNFLKLIVAKFVCAVVIVVVVVVVITNKQTMYTNALTLATCLEKKNTLSKSKKFKLIPFTLFIISLFGQFTLVHLHYILPFYHFTFIRKIVKV